MNKNILVFGAHPDDCEIGMGGTIRKLVNLGYKVIVVDLTQGEMSTNGNIFLRQRESENSGKILGIDKRHNLRMQDRNITRDIRSVEVIAKCIRMHNPGLVFYPSPNDPHPDHVAASKLIEEAIFHAKLSKFDCGYDPVQVKKSFMYHINEQINPDMYIDISDEFSEKMSALKSYKSQFDTDISREKTRLNEGFLNYITSLNFINGYKAGCNYAECFTAVKPITIHSSAALEAIINE